MSEPKPGCFKRRNGYIFLAGNELRYIDKDMLINISGPVFIVLPGNELWYVNGKNQRFKAINFKYVKDVPIKNDIPVRDDGKPILFHKVSLTEILFL